MDGFGILEATDLNVLNRNLIASTWLTASTILLAIATMLTSVQHCFGNP
jgi:hypothetical protein